MIRSLRDEVERYGHYSLAAESMYDHPFQWGSERTGPDLARVGGKYSDEWQFGHLADPRSVVPESIMPPYKFLCGNAARLSRHAGSAESQPHCRRALYGRRDRQCGKRTSRHRPIANSDGVDALQKRYPKAQAHDFGGNRQITEADALIAYLQMLGTMVDFKTYQANAPENRR